MGDSGPAEEAFGYWPWNLCFLARLFKGGFVLGTWGEDLPGKSSLGRLRADSEESPLKEDSSDRVKQQGPAKGPGQTL